MTDPARRRLVPDHVVDEVKRRVDIGAVIGRTVKLTRRGRDLVGLCPFHDEKTPSFNVSPNAGLFHCFGCRASGDVVAFVMRSTGRGFADALADLAAEAGVTLQGEGQGDRPLPAPSPRPAPLPTPEPQRPSPAAVSAAWDALCSRQSLDSPATRWLDGRGIPARLVGSGFAAWDARAVLDLADAPATMRLRRYVDDALVAPLRSARGADVVALQVRVFHPVEGDPKVISIGNTRDDDGTPRAYGRADHVEGASLVLLVEGMADTFAAEALTAHAPGVVVVGVHSKSAFPALARWIVERGRTPVVVVPHLDHMGKDTAAAKAEAARNVREALDVLGARGRRFVWADPTGGYLRRLLAVGVDTSSRIGAGFDLADTLAAARAAGVPFDTVAASFVDFIGAKHSPPGGSS